MIRFAVCKNGGSRWGTFQTPCKALFLRVSLLPSSKTAWSFCRRKQPATKHQTFKCMIKNYCEFFVTFWKKLSCQKGEIFGCWSQKTNDEETTHKCSDGRSPHVSSLFVVRVKADDHRIAERDLDGPRGGLQLCRCSNALKINLISISLNLFEKEVADENNFVDIIWSLIRSNYFLYFLEKNVKIYPSG